MDVPRKRWASIIRINHRSVHMERKYKVDKAVHLCYELSRLEFKNKGTKGGSSLIVNEEEI